MQPKRAGDEGNVTQTKLTIAICTRDRPVELTRCVESVLVSARRGQKRDVELILVDDGTLSEVVTTDLRARVTAAGLTFRARRNVLGSGLFLARLAAIGQALGEVILFLDDDVTVAPDYLGTLFSLFEHYPAAAGIGGVDELDRPRPWPVHLLHRLFLVDSGRPGSLSVSGYAGSLHGWAVQRADFMSEYLAGFNMAFRRSALAHLAEVDWLRGYSLGEDLYVSLVARATGQLIVSPELRVSHHRSASSRENPAAVARAQVVNMFHLLRLRGASRLRMAGLLWTVTWLVLRDAIRLRRLPHLPGYAKGIWDILALPWTSNVASQGLAVVDRRGRVRN